MTVDYQTQYEHLVYWVVRKWHRHSDYDDLLQEARLGLALAERDFNPLLSVKFQTYAVTRMRGRVIQYFRDKSRLIRLPDNRRVDHADLPHVTASLDASETDWEGWARLGVHDLNLDHLVLKLAIGKLKPDYRAIIRLIYLQQCSQVSVARMLHCTPNNIYSKRLRALSKLRTILGGAFDVS